MMVVMMMMMVMVRMVRMAMNAKKKENLIKKNQFNLTCTQRKP